MAQPVRRQEAPLKRPHHPKELKNITRFDYGRTHAWYVRFQRRQPGGERQIFGRYFYDGTCGGKAKALVEAQRWRDAMATKVPPARQYRSSNAAPLGQWYVKHVTRIYKAGNTYKSYEALEAWVKVKDRWTSSNYSIDKWGTKVARQKLMEWIKRKQPKR